MNRFDFRDLADVRISEAKALLDQKKWDGAYYLAGYAVECALKACIAKLTREHDFPPTKNYSVDCFSHDLAKLITLAGLRQDWLADTKVDPDLDRNWAVVLDWTEASRYQRKSTVDAEALYNAIVDPAHGVLTWLSKHY